MEERHEGAILHLHFSEVWLDEVAGANFIQGRAVRLRVQTSPPGCRGAEVAPRLEFREQKTQETRGQGLCTGRRRSAVDAAKIQMHFLSVGGSSGVSLRADFVLGGAHVEGNTQLLIQLYHSTSCIIP